VKRSVGESCRLRMAFTAPEPVRNLRYSFLAAHARVQSSSMPVDHVPRLRRLAHQHVAGSRPEYPVRVHGLHQLRQVGPREPVKDADRLNLHRARPPGPEELVVR